MLMGFSLINHPFLISPFMEPPFHLPLLSSVQEAFSTLKGQRGPSPSPTSAMKGPSGRWTTSTTWSPHFTWCILISCGSSWIPCPKITKCQTSWRRPIIPIDVGRRHKNHHIPRDPAEFHRYHGHPSQYWKC